MLPKSYFINFFSMEDGKWAGSVYTAILCLPQDVSHAYENTEKHVYVGI